MRANRGECEEDRMMAFHNIRSGRRLEDTAAPGARRRRRRRAVFQRETVRGGGDPCDIRKRCGTVTLDYRDERYVKAHTGKRRRWTSASTTVHRENRSSGRTWIQCSPFQVSDPHRNRKRFANVDHDMPDCV